MNDVRVIGAGLSGLATAWYLMDAGFRPRVIEAAPSAGGLIHTLHTPQGLVETAARGFMWSPRVAALFESAGLAPAFAREESRRRYIFRDGRPRRWPLSPLESAGAALRFGSSWIARASRPREHETVDAWGRRVLGAAATRWLLAPALQGIYATPPERLSARAIFGPGRIRGKLTAPAAGMGALLDRLHARLAERGATFEFGTAVDALDAGVPTVVSTSAPAAARLLAPHAPRLSGAISRIQMVSLLPVTAFFEPRADDLRGFGVLFPRGTADALGVLFNADIFADRSALRSETWIYGSLSPEALPQGGAAAAARVAADRRYLCGNRADTPLAIHTLPSPAELPVYDAAVLAAQAERSELPAWIALAGNYLGRLGVSALLEEAAAAAHRLASISGPRKSIPGPHE